MSTGGLLSTAGMRAADAAAIAAGTASTDLMDAAGRSVAEAIASRFAPCPVLVLCGPGNNGGDGFVAAHYLRDLGWPDVSVALLGQLASLQGDAAWAAGRWGSPVQAWPQGVTPGIGLIVDAVFGTGLSRPVPDAVRTLLEASDTIPRVAVDVPSGLTGDGSFGFAPWLTDLPPAALTVTFHARKPAHVFAESASVCGEIVVAPIGIDPALVPPDAVTLNDPKHWSELLPRPDALSHKHRRGRLAVVCGPRHATGAARLAARGGARIGAGWTSLIASPQAADILAAHETALVLEVPPNDAAFDATIRRHHAVVAGPAWGTGAREAEQLALLIAAGPALVLDADALALLATDGVLRQAVSARPFDTVLTPHDGEFERLFSPHLDPETEACRLSSTRAAARLAGAVVVRKGAVSVIAAPDGRARLNTHASPWLASAGTGDVLAGMIGGLLVQGMDAFEAASAAVWIHGDCGRRVGPGLISSDLEAQVGPSLRALGVR